MNRLPRSPVAAGLLSLCGGCATVVDGSSATILREVGKAHLGSALWEIATCTLLGAVGGGVVAVAAFFLIRALGGYRGEGNYPHRFRVLTLVVLLLLCPLLMGLMGLAQGVLHGYEVILRRSQIGTELLPEVGKVGADLVAVLHLTAPRLASEDVADIAIPWDDLERFDSGKWELDVHELAERIGMISDTSAELIAGQLETRVLGQFPGWQGGVGQDLLHWSLPRLIRHLLEEKVQTTLSVNSATMLDELKKEAGAGKTLSRTRLAHFLTQHALIPPLLSPVRQGVRVLQIKLAIGLILLLVLPVLAFRLADYRRRRVQRAAAENEPG